jgi:hypothetical protein
MSGQQSMVSVRHGFVSHLVAVQVLNSRTGDWTGKGRALLVLLGAKLRSTGIYLYTPRVGP